MDSESASVSTQSRKRLRTSLANKSSRVCKFCGEEDVHLYLPMTAAVTEKDGPCPAHVTTPVISMKDASKNFV